MSDPKWRVRVMYYLPAEPKLHAETKTFTAYLEMMSVFQTHSGIPGYSESHASGFWKDKQDNVYFDEVSIVAVDYDTPRNEEALNKHIEEIKGIIDATYRINDCEQLVIYVTAQDLTIH